MTLETDTKYVIIVKVSYLVFKLLLGYVGLTVASVDIEMDCKTVCYNEIYVYAV